MPRSTLVVVLLLAGGTVASCGDDDVPGDASPATVLLDESSDTSTGTASTSEVEASPSTAVATMPEITAGPTTPSTEPPPETSAGRPGGNVRTMASFAEAGSIDGWSNVDDTVMGGVSASTTSWQAGQLVFAGDLSLEKNGGFTSVRSPQDPAFGSALDGARAIALTAEGDGKTYVMRVGGAGRGWSYIQRFGTEAGKQLIISEFERLRPASKGLLSVAAVHSWTTDPFSAGDWAIFQPGQVRELRAAIATPHQRLFFCGEHTAIGSRGMEGALESAERVSLEVLAATA